MKTTEIIAELRKALAVGDSPVFCGGTFVPKQLAKEAADRLEFMDSLKGSRLELARMYWAVVAERDRLREEVSDLRKDIEALNEVSEDWRCVAENMCAKLKVARAERNQAWEKLARITGEREAAWLSEEVSE